MYGSSTCVPRPCPRHRHLCTLLLTALQLAWTAANRRERQLKCSASVLILHLHLSGGVIVDCSSAGMDGGKIPSVWSVRRGGRGAFVFWPGGRTTRLFLQPFRLRTCEPAALSAAAHTSNPLETDVQRPPVAVVTPVAAHRDVRLHVLCASIHLSTYPPIHLSPS